jgi:hypothetical protein
MPPEKNTVFMPMQKGLKWKWERVNVHKKIY